MFFCNTRGDLKLRQRNPVARFLMAVRFPDDGINNTAIPARESEFNARQRLKEFVCNSCIAIPK